MNSVPVKLRGVHMKVTKIRHAWPEGKNFEIIRPNGTLDDYIFLHFWNPMQLFYRGKMITTLPNACIIFSPGAMQHFGSKDACVHDWMHITADVGQLLDEYGIETERLYYPKNHEFITDLVRKIEIEIKSHYSYGEELSQSFLRELLLRFAREVSFAEDSENLNGQTKQQLKHLRGLLHSDYTKRWNVSDMANYINLSTSYLYSAYKKLYGVSPVQDLINIRIQRAKSMLAESQKSVSEIAAMIGYSNPSHFIRQFTKNVGVSPLKYRQNNLLEHRDIL